MNREIRFRGKDAQGNWQYGNLFVTSNGATFIMKPTSKEYHIAESIPVDKKSVGQYVSFKDCNRKEIYEGDIVRWIFHNNEEKARVVMDKGCFCVDIPEGKYPLHHYLNQGLEVIGNIYEDKELLEK